jgi:hypothetical protein
MLIFLTNFNISITLVGKLQKRSILTKIEITKNYFLF